MCQWRAPSALLLPKLREEPDNTLIVVDGYSCREQVRQGTGKRAYNLAELIGITAEEGPETSEETKGAA